MVGKIKVLLFAANPHATERLFLDEQVRAITVKLRAAAHRDAVEITPFLAARPDDLLQGLNQYKPHIVHFSGHGSAYGEVVLVDALGGPKPVTPQALTTLFRTLKDNVKVVLFNACWSQIQAQAIVEVIDCVIGMKGFIEDAAAIDFASNFYRAIGFNRTVREAFDQACVGTLLEGHRRNGEPQLLTRIGSDGDFKLLNEMDSDAFYPNTHQSKLEIYAKRNDGVQVGENNGTIIFNNNAELKPEISVDQILNEVESNLLKNAYEEALACLEKIADDSRQLARKRLLKAIALIGGRPFNVLSQAERKSVETILIYSAEHFVNSSLPFLLLAALEMDYYHRHGMRGASGVTPEIVRRKIQENNLSAQETRLFNLVPVSENVKFFMKSL
jgi:hypothetical protein